MMQDKHVSEIFMNARQIYYLVTSNRPAKAETGK